jgi:hypothetical protein
MIETALLLGVAVPIAFVIAFLVGAGLSLLLERRHAAMDDRQTARSGRLDSPWPPGSAPGALLAIGGRTSVSGGRSVSAPLPMHFRAVGQCDAGG